MNGSTDTSSFPFERIEAMILAGERGELTAAEMEELGRILRDHAQARRFYARYMLETVSLREWAACGSPDEGGFPSAVVGEDRRAESENISGTTVPSAPQLSFLGDAWHGTVGYFSSGWPVAYLIATVVFGVGLLIGSLVPVSQQPAQVAKQSSMPVQRDAEPYLVAQISGMADCRWSKDGRPPYGYDGVPVGRRFKLDSGLLEITYRSGAKVVLQGPVTYEVESAVSGFLSVGKLNARLEKKGEGGRRKAEGSNPQSLIPNPSFAIRTPTATVTDLGTEFGVEVNREGGTETHVFAGKVKMKGRGSTVNVNLPEAADSAEHILVAGQTAKVASDTAVETVAEGNRARFVRELPATSARGPQLIDQVDYSDTWAANSPTRAGSYLRLEDVVSLQVERCFGNPQRSWVFSRVASMTTCPSDDSPVPWPGYQVPGLKSGFLESGGSGICYFGFEYGLRDDFVVQFDAVQTEDRINITIGDEPATIDSNRSFSVLFRARGTPRPEVGVYTPSKGEVETGLHSGIPISLQWHNYAVRFILPEKRFGVWVDRQYRGTIDLAGITKGMEGSGIGTWAGLPWTNRCVSVGGYSNKGEGRVWTDNFQVGSPSEIALPTGARQPAHSRTPEED